MGDGNDYGGVQQPAGGYGAGSADAPPGYGDVQNPPSPYDKKPAPAPPPDLIAQVKSDLDAINKSRQGADIFDMQLHRNYDAFKMFAAWTNDAKSIYVNLKYFEDHKAEFDKNSNNWSPQEFKNNRRAFTLYVLAHELEHITQFISNHGHPKLFTQMIEFEFLAYRSGAVWVGDKQDQILLSQLTGATRDFFGGLADSAKAGLASYDAMRKITDNDEAQKQLIADGDLPATLPKAQVAKGKLYTMDDLYKAAPR